MLVLVATISHHSTLVNYILKEQREWKICVLENEFGEVSIDDGLGECGKKRSVKEFPPRSFGSNPALYGSQSPNPWTPPRI